MKVCKTKPGISGQTLSSDGLDSEQRRLAAAVVLAAFSVFSGLTSVYYSGLYCKYCPKGFTFSLPCIFTGIITVEMVAISVLCATGAFYSLVSEKQQDTSLKRSHAKTLQPSNKTP